MKFTDDQKRWLRAEGVPPQMIYHWERGAGIGRKYARIVGKVLGKNPIDVIDPIEPKTDPAA